MVILRKERTGRAASAGNCRIAGDSPETLGGIRLEAIIVGQNENVDFASGLHRCQPICSGFARKGGAVYLLPFGTVTVTLFVVALPELSSACTVIV